MNQSIGLRRLHSQRISRPAFTRAAEVVAWLGAVQGQDYIGTKWAIGLRLPGSTEASINQAIASGEIMRTWAVRGTLHYVAPADIHWLLGLIAPRLLAGNAARYKELELDPATLERSTDLIAQAVHDGQHLSRPELLTLLEQHGISTAGQRGVYMLQRPGLLRLIYQAEMRGKDTTFRPLGAGQTLPPAEAAAELARRYFTSRGPATLADFVQWSGLLISEARAALQAVSTQLVEETLDGQSCWCSAEPPQPPDRSLYLLPGFDEFYLGYKDRSAVLDLQFADAICPGGNGVFNPTIISGGRIVGIWKRTLKKKTVEISFTPFWPLHTDEIEQAAEAAARFAAFMGLTAVIKPVGQP